MTKQLFRRSGAVALCLAVSALALGACNKPAADIAATAPSDGTATLTSAPGGPSYSTDQGGPPGSGSYGGGYEQRTPTAYADNPPPALPDYEQPPIPGEGYVWTPGYWAWNGGAGDYYWVPGTWARPPRPGLLWTPGYWRFADGRYGFIAGYWGARVGFYGGVNYGYGYGGSGYQGGRWQGERFTYNDAVNNLASGRVANVYHEGLRRAPTYAGPGAAPPSPGFGGLFARPTADEAQAVQAPHEAPTGEQQQHFQAAQNNPGLRASTNLGRPAVAATARPGEFEAPDAVRTVRSAPEYHPPAGGGFHGDRGPGAGPDQRRPGEGERR